MQRLTVALVVLLAFPAAASAAPLNELPFTERAGVACLTATGVPGGLAIVGAYSPHDVTTDLLTAGPDTATRSAGVSVGRLYSCAAVAEAAGGAAVVAGAVQRSEESNRFAIRAVIRDPGDAFAEAIELGRGDDEPVVAIAPTGHAVVAWVQRGPHRGRIVAARRAPGGAFGAPEPIVAWRSRSFALVELAAGIDSAGRATLLWGRDIPNAQDALVETAAATPGASFTVQRLTARVEYFADPVLAVAADGWALVAHRRDDDRPIAVFERAPGAARFVPAALRPPPYAYVGADEPAVAVRAGGGALVAWRAGIDFDREVIQVVTREGPGAFGARRGATAGRVVLPLDSLAPSVDLHERVPLTQPPEDFDYPRLAAALAPDGRALLAWTSGSGRGPQPAVVARSALGRLGGDFEPSQVLGGALRESTDVAPLFLPDGRAAVGWTDNADRGHGRLHLAVEGAPSPMPRRVRLRLRAPRVQRLFAGQSPRVLATCGGPCDLRATVVGAFGPTTPATATFAAGGTRRLDLGGVDGIARRLRRIRVTVAASAPGARRIVTRELRLRVAKRPAPPVLRPRRLQARRSGDSIVVTWRTAGPARRQQVLVQGRPTRHESDDTNPGAAAVVHAGGRRRHSVALHPDRPDGVRWVSLAVLGLDGGWSFPEPVRVR